MTEVVTGTQIVLFGLTSLTSALSVTWIKHYNLTERVVIYVSAGYAALVGIYALRLRWKIKGLKRKHAYN
jgi:hypothetical protein